MLNGALTPEDNRNASDRIGPIQPSFHYDRKNKKEELKQGRRGAASGAGRKKRT